MTDAYSAPWLAPWWQLRPQRDVGLHMALTLQHAAAGCCLSLVARFCHQTWWRSSAAWPHRSAQSPEMPPPITDPKEVVARIFIDVHSGEVDRIELVTTDAGALGTAVMSAATHFNFSPATLDGLPIAAGIVFRQTFLPRPKIAPRPTGELAGDLWEKGTHRPVPGGLIRALGPDLDIQVKTDAIGGFRLTLPAGVARLEATRAGYKAFVVSENIRAEQKLQVRYLIERDFYNTYETIVVAQANRSEVARTSLQGAEISSVPGTFGDPFRVVMAMPGVQAVFSLLGNPIVRGTSPGSTGFLLDGVPLPSLFHLLFGPSVVHPEFIDRVDFYPGMFPANYGGYVGGLIDGITRRANPADKRIDADVNLTQAGLFLRGPVSDKITGTLAGRYGYPGFLLGLTSVPFNLTYWDYQGRLDGPLAQGRWKIFAFGALDHFSSTPSGPATSGSEYGTQFHRLQIGWSQDNGAFNQSYLLVGGVDETLAGGTLSDLRAYKIFPRARWEVALGDRARLQLGVDVALQWYEGFTSAAAAPVWSHLDTLGGYLALPWTVVDDFILTLSARTDYYTNGTITQQSYDPRLTWRWRLHRGELGDLWLKGGIGRYHQPPRWVVPLPGLDNLGLSEGLLGSYQSTVGAEVPIAPAISLDVQAYFNYMDRIIFDLAVNYDPLAPPQSSLPQSNTGATIPDLLGNLSGPSIGRSYGIEFLLRHRDEGDTFGWISYTLSRSERLDGDVWRLYDFDRTHSVQLVGGWRMPRNWQFGARAQYTTGRPVDTGATFNVARSPAFYRFDIRIDKHVVYNSWLLDFYIDIINIAFTPEYLDQTSQSLRYVLPTFGLRAVL